jgi:N-acyl-D-amino-acid deacylase
MDESSVSKSPVFDRRADAVIVGGVVYDGSGALGVSADVALFGDAIVMIGSDLRGRFPGVKTYDARGCAVAPGFIDIHTHSDLSILTNREMQSSVHQGVTTELAGNCGIAMGLIIPDSDVFRQEMSWLKRDGLGLGWSRMSGFFDRLEADGISCNLGSLAGHGTVRKAVMGFAERAPDESELASMRRLIEMAMDDGAVGFSTGLEYLPGGYAKLDEICALAEVVQKAGGFYASHLRSEGDAFLEAVEETIAVGERTGISVQLSHHKAEGRANWGKVKETLVRMQRARDAGIDVLTDQYPYTAFMTGLTLILLPPWARNGSPEDVLARLTDAETRARIEREIENLNLDYDAIRIGVARGHTQMQGLSLTQLGKSTGASPVSAAIDLLIAENGWVGAAHFALSEADVELVLHDAHTMIGSDGVATAPGAPERPHPRTYGTFPRVLGRYVRERGVLSLPDAIRRMTSLPAQRLKLSDRGHIAVGMKADITVFRADSIGDQATFEDPQQFPTGIEYVFVNGRLTIDRGNHTGARAGVVLRRKALL